MATQISVLLDAQTTTGVGGVSELSNKDARSFQCSVAGTGAVAANVDIEVSNDGVTYSVLQTVTLSGTTSAQSVAYMKSFPFRYVRAEVTSISGTGAAVTVTMN